MARSEQHELSLMLYIDAGDVESPATGEGLPRSFVLTWMTSLSKIYDRVDPEPDKRWYLTSYEPETLAPAGSQRGYVEYVWAADNSLVGDPGRELLLDWLRANGYEKAEAEKPLYVRREMQPQASRRWL